jgi:hypothetical protein
VIQQLDMSLGAIVLVAFIAGYAVVSYVIGKIKVRRVANKLNNESRQSELK